MIQIDKNIPMTASYESKDGLTVKIREMIMVMEVGDSTVIECESANRLNSSLQRIPSRAGLGIKFSLRKIGQGVYRVWRVK